MLRIVSFLVFCLFITLSSPAEARGNKDSSERVGKNSDAEQVLDDQNHIKSTPYVPYHAQKTKALDVDNTLKPSVERGSLSEFIEFMERVGIYLVGLIVLLAIGSLISVIYLFGMVGEDSDYPKYLVIVIAIFSGILITVAGYSERQSAPMFGLLGTIIGYLFGVTRARSDSHDRSRDAIKGDVGKGKLVDKQDE